MDKDRRTVRDYFRARHMHGASLPAIQFQYSRMMVKDAIARIRRKERR